MGTTVPGGRYITSDGRVVNAHGEPLEVKGAAPVASQPEPAYLPVGFPHRNALTRAGYRTLDSVRNATDAELRAVPTVGPAAVKVIRDA